MTTMMAAALRFTKQSTNIHSATYDPMTRTLVVRFVSDPHTLHTFDDVEPDVVDKFTKAKSPGAYFAKAIKGGDYDHTAKKLSVADAALLTPFVHALAPTNDVIVLVAPGVVEVWTVAHRADAIRRRDELATKHGGQMNVTWLQGTMRS